MYKPIGSFDPVNFFNTTTIEGALISLEIMIFWRVIDTAQAAKNGLEILTQDEQYSTINQDKAI